ncbi:hypothetical protein GEMRC1_007832 [Eukaryota sp. GEM-RC1]
MDLHQLLNKLNISLEKRLSRVNLDEFETSDLHDLLFEVCGLIDKEAVEKALTYPPSESFNQVLELIQVFEYPTLDHESLSEQLLDGNRNAIYNLMLYILNNVEDLKKKVYLSRFLSPVNVAPDFVMHDDVSHSKTQLEELQDEFRNAQNELTSLEVKGQHVTDLTREISKMESEKNRLTQAVHSKRHHLSEMVSDSELRTLMDLAQRVRKEEQQNSEQRQSWTSQNLKYSSILDQNRRLTQSMNTMLSMKSGDPIPLLEAEVSQLEQYVMNELPAKVSSLRDQIGLYSLGDSTSDYELREKVDELKRKESDLKSIISQYKSDRNSRPSNDPLNVFRGRADALEGKKKKAVDKLQKEKLKNKELKEELGAFEDVHGPLLTRDQLRAFASQVSKLRSKFSEAKQELSERQTELSVLDNTITTLTDTWPQVNFDKFQNSENIEPEEETVDELLEDEVEQVNTLLLQQKKIVQPIVKSYKQLKAEFQTLNTTYSEAKEEFDKATDGIVTEVDALRQTVAKYDNQCALYESQYFVFKDKISSLLLLLSRAKKEVGYRKNDGRLSADHQSHKAMFEQVIKGQRETYKELNVRKKFVDENKDTGLKQVKYFEDLLILLKAKHQSNEEDFEHENPNVLETLDLDSLDI